MMETDEHVSEEAETPAAQAVAERLQRNQASAAFGFRHRASDDAANGVLRRGDGILSRRDDLLQVIERPADRVDALTDVLGRRRRRREPRLGQFLIACSNFDSVAACISPRRSGVSRSRASCSAAISKSPRCSPSAAVLPASGFGIPASGGFTSAGAKRSASGAKSAHKAGGVLCRGGHQGRVDAERFDTVGLLGPRVGYQFEKVERAALARSGAFGGSTIRAARTPSFDDIVSA
jgi:hypothetical protein